MPVPLSSVGHVHAAAACTLMCAWCGHRCSTRALAAPPGRARCMQHGVLNAPAWPREPRKACQHAVHRTCQQPHGHGHGCTLSLPCHAMACCVLRAVGCRPSLGHAASAASARSCRRAAMALWSGPAGHVSVSRQGPRCTRRPACCVPCTRHAPAVHTAQRVLNCDKLRVVTRMGQAVRDAGQLACHHSTCVP